MRHRLFTILSALMVPLCMTTVGLWVLSYRHNEFGDLLALGDALHRRWSLSLSPEEVLGYQGPGGGVMDEVKSCKGHIFVVTSPPSAKHKFKPGKWELRCGATDWLSFFPDAPWWYMGFNYRHDTDLVLIAVPYWALTVAFAVLPGLWLRTVLRRRRAKRLGLCPACGYDLRATPDRCPECGTPFVAKDDTTVTPSPP